MKRWELHGPYIAVHCQFIAIVSPRGDLEAVKASCLAYELREIRAHSKFMRCLSPLVI